MLSTRQLPLSKQAQEPNIHIPIDAEGAWKLVQELVDGAPQDDYGFIDGESTSKRILKDLAGRTYLVTFMLVPINDWMADYSSQSVSGMIDKDLGTEKESDEMLGASIGLYINDWNLGQQLDIIKYDFGSNKATINSSDKDAKQALNNLRYTHTYRALIHELTHLMDPEKAEDPFAPDALHGLEAEDLQRYYNQPRELRAHFQEILEEILSEFEETDTVDSALAKSYQWREMEPFLTEENKQAIHTGVAQWFSASEQASDHREPS